MWTYLQRWQVANSLYHLQRKRDNIRWVQEYDLIAWITGSDLNEEIPFGDEAFLNKARRRLSYIFFGVSKHDDLYTKIRNIINECEDRDVNWIIRDKENNFHIYLNLTTRGREIYPYSHLIGIIFSNYYVKWGTTILIIWLLGYFLNINIQPK